MKTTKYPSLLVLALGSITVLSLLATTHIVFSLLNDDWMPHGTFTSFRTINLVWLGTTLIIAILLGVLLLRTFRKYENLMHGRFQNEEYLRSLLNSSPMFVTRVDTEGRYTYGNRAFLEAFVSTEDRVHFVGTPSLNYIIPEDHALISQAIERCIANPDTPVYLTFRKPTPNGEILTSDWEFSAIRGADGTITEFQCSGLNVTESRRLEQKLNEEQLNKAGLMNTIHAIVWEADADTFQFHYVSAAAELILGYPSEQWLSEPDFWQNHIHPSDKERAITFCTDETRAMRNHDFEYRFLKADGSTAWLRDIITVISEAGKPTLLKGVMIDITEQKHAQMQLLEQERFISGLLETMPGAVYVVDVLQGRNIFTTDTNAQLTGYTPEEIQAMGASYFTECFHPEDFANNLQQSEILAASPDGTVMEVAYRHRHKDGRWLWLLSREVVLERNSQNDVTKRLGIVMDITNRKNAEDISAQAAKQFRFLLDTAPLFITITTIQDGRPLFNNAKMREFVGISDTTAEQPHSREYYVNPTDQPRILEMIRTNGRVDNYEIALKKINGEEWWALLSIVPIDFEGEQALFSVHYDITVQKHTTEALRKSEANLKAIFNTSVQVHFLIDNDFRILAMNTLAQTSVRQAFGREIALGDDIRDYTLSTKKEIFETNVRRAFKGEIIWYESSIELPTMGTLWYEFQYVPVMDENGVITSVSFSTLDTTERKTMTQQVTEYSQRLQHIIDAMMDGLVLWDEQQRIVLVNPAIETMFGYTAEQFIGRNVADVIPHSLNAHAMTIMEEFQAQENTQMRVRDATGVNANGIEFPLDVSLTSFSVNGAWMTLAIVRDVSEQQQAHEEILQLNKTLEHRVETRTQALKQLNAEKDEFLGIAAHDLKNPLAGVLSSAEILQRHFADNPTAIRFLTMIVSASEQMLDIITNLLDVN
ncbi:MAG: PAS domain S-box protein, partial [Candidatus Kapaibacteriota bacterium]